MSVAKALKMREYGTSVINHDLSYSNTVDQSNRVRMTDTHMSKVLDRVDLEPAPV